ncbi:hypothetical protein BSONL12_00530 [Bacillus sonorensis L12]|uniref:Uncharacterized protein n=1 Tax=Bacillus sonorensis L12 TaxID=1274524 RepID=M5PGI0_9BACI|nr:hypothetical protein BSONL12_00530 [Bacillus sonorensis L12]
MAPGLSADPRYIKKDAADISRIFFHYAAVSMTSTIIPVFASTMTSYCSSSPKTDRVIPVL